MVKDGGFPCIIQPNNDNFVLWNKENTNDLLIKNKLFKCPILPFLSSYGINQCMELYTFLELKRTSCKTRRSVLLVSPSPPTSVEQYEISLEDISMRNPWSRRPWSLHPAWTPTPTFITNFYPLLPKTCLYLNFHVFLQ